MQYKIIFVVCLSIIFVCELLGFRYYLLNCHKGRIVDTVIAVLIIFVCIANNAIPFGNKTIIVSDSYSQIAEMFEHIFNLFEGKAEFFYTNYLGSGVEIFSTKIQVFYPLMPLEDFINTNGAGDGFAAGFLFAYHQNQPLEQCVHMGHKVACNVLKTDLSYLPKDDCHD